MAGTTEMRANRGRRTACPLRAALQISLANTETVFNVEIFYVYNLHFYSKLTFMSYISPKEEPHPPSLKRKHTVFISRLLRLCF